MTVFADAAELRGKLTAARVELQDAERVLRMVRAHAEDAAGGPLETAAGVELTVAARRVELWRGVVAELVRRLHRLGDLDA